MGKVHLHRSADGGYYCNIIARNGKETWRMSETVKSRGSAFKAVHSIAAIFGSWDGTYVDHTKSKK